MKKNILLIYTGGTIGMVKHKIKKTLEIATKVDWPCELKTLISDKNQGYKNGVSIEEINK